MLLLEGLLICLEQGITTIQSPYSLHGSGVAQCFDMLHNLGHTLSRDIKTVEHKTEQAMMQLRHGDLGPSSPAHGREKGSGALLINPGISSAQHDPF